MSIFRKKSVTTAAPQIAPAYGPLAEIALMSIHDGVVITDKSGVIKMLNPAAVAMLDCKHPSNALGLDYGLLMPIESKEGRELSPAENMFSVAMRTGQPLENYQVCLISGAAKKRIPIAISVAPASGDYRVVTFRNITRELAEEGEQAEFISTASHEMRTPVASIEGYLGLALNPHTATIDDRARGYLESAHKASQHLGHLFQDLLDITKLDDNRIRPTFRPVEMTGLIKQLTDAFAVRLRDAGLKYQFGTDNALGSGHQVSQVVYASVDVNFLNEIVDNLMDNAIKYTPKGGSVYVGVRGDGDRVLINITDTGIGISGDDLPHIFQKFYRADNSDTRTIGGTGLGLYLVKQRTEAMGGRVWAESSFGQGTTFYVSLPRISGEEYERRMIAFSSQAMMNASPATPTTPILSPPAGPIPAPPSAAPAPAMSPNTPIVSLNNNQGVTL